MKTIDVRIRGFTEQEYRQLRIAHFQAGIKSINVWAKAVLLEEAKKIQIKTSEREIAKEISR
jgi:hypothetical protein